MLVVDLLPLNTKFKLPKTAVVLVLLLLVGKLLLPLQTVLVCDMVLVAKLGVGDGFILLGFGDLVRGLPFAVLNVDVVAVFL